MKKIIVFGASSSSKSINKQLATYAGTQIKGAQSTVIDLNDYEMPIYSMDREEANGVPEPAKTFVGEIESSEGVIISLAEHNGSYSTAFKNIFDWATRFKQKVWSDKPMLILSTSPGPRGASGVLGTAKMSFPYLGATVAATFSLPSFNDNFSPEDGIKNPELEKGFNEAIKIFTEALNG